MPGHWRTTADAGTFLAAARDFLACRRIELTVPTTIVSSLLDGGPSFSDEAPRLAWFSDDPDGAGAFTSAVAVQTPPHQLVVSRLDAQAAHALAAHRDRPRRILADIATARLLAAAWGARSRVRGRERLHRLDGLVEPDSSGSTRVAGPVDADLVRSWRRAFHAETTPDAPAPLRGHVEAALADRRVLLHEVDGVPVSLAQRTPPSFGVGRIGPVYTPPEHRRHGHAAAVTAAAARQAQRAGADEIVLFTDLANPTSNALYARLGFVGVLDVVEVDLLGP